MKLLNFLMMFFVTSIFCNAQEFSLIKEISNTAPTVVLGSDAPQDPKNPATPVQVGSLKIEVSAISVLITKDAVIRETVSGEKAVFITGNVEKVEKGVKVKLIGAISSPLLKAHKAPVFFPPTILSQYDEKDQSWFFTGINGTYTIEILDNVNGKWTAEYVNVVLKDGPVIIDPVDPVDPIDPPPTGDYAAVAEITTKLVSELNDPIVATALCKEYEIAYKKLDAQSLNDMRKIMSEARRTAFLSVENRNVNWNPVLIQIDKTIGDIKTPIEFKKAMAAFVGGFKKAVKP